MYGETREAVSKWESYNICFSKAALLISGLVFSHAFVEEAFFNVLMSFITSSWESYHLPKVAAIVNAQEGVSILVALMLSYVADTENGLAILCFHSGGTGTFYLGLALLLVTLGKGGRSPALKAFLRDQFGNLEMEEESKRADARQQFWWPTAWFLGIGCYKKESPQRNFRSEMTNWRSLSRLVPVWMTFLIYCLVEAAGTTFFIEQSDNLEDGIGKGFRIPITFFPALKSLTSFVTCQLVDFIITSKLQKENQPKRAFVASIAIGMLVSFLCCMTAWQVKVRRLKLINELWDIQNDSIRMNILWLTPQFLLLGIMGGLVEEGMEGSFYEMVPKSMRMYELPFNKIVMGMGKILSIGTIFVFRGWFGDTSHLDRYYRMLAIVSIGSLAYFTVAAYNACYWNYMAPQEDNNEANASEGIEIVVDQSGSEPSGQSLLKVNFFPQGDSMAARHSGWKSVRDSLRI
ncbi:hypothetical protein V6N13_143283 [Hibiscus sabdariffa]